MSGGVLLEQNCLIAAPAGPGDTDSKTGKGIVTVETPASRLVVAHERNGNQKSKIRLTRRRQYNQTMERKIFWLVFAILGLLADFLLPFWWAVGATIPILFISWWVAYRSEWF